MVFCNCTLKDINCSYKDSHNPYFNRWFSAIKNGASLVMLIKGHNPYFNRWFSAMQDKELFKLLLAESQSLF